MASKICKERGRKNAFKRGSSAFETLPVSRLSRENKKCLIEIGAVLTFYQDCNLV